MHMAMLQEVTDADAGAEHCTAGVGEDCQVADVDSVLKLLRSAARCRSILHGAMKLLRINARGAAAMRRCV
jgi:hypothetical protein